MRIIYDPGDIRRPEKAGTHPFWWVGQFILTAFSCFFVFFGISLLIAAYQLKDPFSFIMTFFAANLIILISAVMVVGFVMRVWRRIQAYQRLGSQNGNVKN